MAEPRISQTAQDSSPGTTYMAHVTHFKFSGSPIIFLERQKLFVKFYTQVDNIIF